MKNILPFSVAAALAVMAPPALAQEKTPQKGPAAAALPAPSYPAPPAAMPITPRTGHIVGNVGDERGNPINPAVAKVMDVHELILVARKSA